jgi:hypothetical protein
MRRKIGIILCSAVVFLMAAAQQPTRPELKFRADGTFKIMQITDTHWRPDRVNLWELLTRSIQAVKPDLIILSGDIITGSDTRKGWDTITQILTEAKIPWAFIFGNHDPEHELTKPQIIEILSALPYSLTENGPETISGNSTYALKVGSSKTSQKTEAVIYCFDSKQQHNWIDFSQIDWYRKLSATFKAENKGTPMPSLAFFHIPIAEYKEVITGKTTEGEYHEPVCDPPLNSGVFASFTECKDVMGMFVGHDHSNNYIGCKDNICLAYGYTTALAETGFYCKVGRGVRVVELYEGKQSFSTWLVKMCDEPVGREKWKLRSQPEIIHRVTYPDSFTE